MQIVPRLARPAAVAALAAAALAIPATLPAPSPVRTASKPRVATGNKLMSDAIELAGQGNWRPTAWPSSTPAGRTRPP